MLKIAIYNRVIAIDKNLSDSMLGKEDKVRSQEEQVEEKAKVTLLEMWFFVS